MKKILFLIGASLTISTASFGQTPTGQGNFIIDPYVGVPNWANSIMYNTYDGTDENVTNYKTNGGMLSYGGRFEYMVADNFGVGLDVNYEVSGFNYDYTSSVYNETTMLYEDITYNYDYKAKKLRGMVRMNYHFVQNERVDAYTGFAGGYKNVNRLITSTNPADSDVSGEALIPVAIRLAVGTRVYFTDNIGAHIELGAFGGALLQFGISAKF